MKLKILYVAYRLIQLFAVVFVADRLDLIFLARFGILLVLFLVYDETEPFIQKIFGDCYILPDIDSFKIWRKDNEENLSLHN